MPTDFSILGKTSALEIEFCGKYTDLRNFYLCLPNNRLFHFSIYHFLYLEWTSIRELYWRTRPWGWVRAIWVAQPLNDKLIFFWGLMICTAKFGPMFTTISWDNWKRVENFNKLSIIKNFPKCYRDVSK